MKRVYPACSALLTMSSIASTLRDKFSLNTEQFAQVLTWLYGSFREEQMQPALFDRYGISEMSDLGYVQMIV